MSRGVVEHTYPLWLRRLAFVCALFVGFAGSAEVVHIHGQWLPQKAVQVGPVSNGSQAPGGEEHCPLCVAMHSTLPVAAYVNLAQLTLVECKLAQVVDRVPEATWHFAMFSRPPPVETL